MEGPAIPRFGCTRNTTFFNLDCWLSSLPSTSPVFTVLWTSVQEIIIVGKLTQKQSSPIPKWIFLQVQASRYEYPFASFTQPYSRLYFCMQASLLGVETYAAPSVSQLAIPSCMLIARCQKQCKKSPSTTTVLYFGSLFWSIACKCSEPQANDFICYEAEHNPIKPLMYLSLLHKPKTTGHWNQNSQLTF